MSEQHKYYYIRTCEETVAHQTINIGGVELPKPETIAPEHGTFYWLFDGSVCDKGVWQRYISKY